jgi:hypothetical protein
MAERHENKEIRPLLHGAHHVVGLLKTDIEGSGKKLRLLLD